MSQVLFVRTLTRQQTRELRGVIRSGSDARMVRRAQIIRLSARGQSPGAIADLLDRSCSGVRKVINRFNAEGFASLADQARQGRPAKTTDRYVALLKQTVQTHPRDLDYPFSCWTLERLREHLARKTRILLSVGYLSQLVAKHGIVYRRPKHSMAHLRDPREYNEKKAFLEFVKKRPLSPRFRSTCSTLMNVRFISTRP